MGKPNDFGREVARLRREKNLTQEQLAEKLDISRAHLGKIETGADAPGRDLLVKLARFFSVSLDYLQACAEPASAPVAQYVVDDPDEISLLELWRDLGEREQAILTAWIHSLRVPKSEVS